MTVSLFVFLYLIWHVQLWVEQAWLPCILLKRKWHVTNDWKGSWSEISSIRDLSWARTSTRPGSISMLFFEFSLLISSNLCSFKSLLSDRKAPSPPQLPGSAQLVYSLNSDFQSTYIQRTHTTDKITANTRSLCSPWTFKKSFVGIFIFRYPHIYIFSCPGQLNRWHCHSLIN